MTESASPPEIAHDLVRRWNISAAFLLADTPSSIVYRVTLQSGAPAIVKSLKPRGMGERPGMTFLHWRDGHVAVRLLKQDETVCLLEDAGSLTLRDYRLSHGETATNAIIKDVLQRLHRPSATSPRGLTSLELHFRSLFCRAEIESDERLRPALRYSADTARQLLGMQENVKPLHGDLHHDNIVSGSARGWLAIDPQGLLGDPAYDIANIFGNPLNALDAILDPNRIRALCNIFADALDCPHDKILRHAIAHAGLSICWSLEDGTPLETNENARERLAFLTVARGLLPDLRA